MSLWCVVTWYAEDIAGTPRVRSVGIREGCSSIHIFPTRHATGRLKPKAAASTLHDWPIAHTLVRSIKSHMTPNETSSNRSRQPSQSVPSTVPMTKAKIRTALREACLSRCYPRSGYARPTQRHWLSHASHQLACPRSQPRVRRRSRHCSSHSRQREPVEWSWPTYRCRMHRLSCCQPSATE